jgi:hypothetical protein
VITFAGKADHNKVATCFAARALMTGETEAKRGDIKKDGAIVTRR